MSVYKDGNIRIYSAIDIADFIVRKCDDLGFGISNLKLQKILYFVQAEFLVSLKKACFEEEIEAWDFGPVVPEVYRKYRVYGGANIPVCFKHNTNELIEKEDGELIEEIIQECNKYSAVDLVGITHSQKPWKDAYKKGENRIITKESIKSYFEGE